MTAEQLGLRRRGRCPHCGYADGTKIYRRQLEEFFVQYFWSGTFARTDFGGMSRLASNPDRYGERQVAFPEWLQSDAHFLEDQLGYGLFYYGGPLWRVGHVEPLQALLRKRTRRTTARKIVAAFPARILPVGTEFYRIRKNLSEADEATASQYDAPPAVFRPSGRLDSPELPVLYASENLEICIHECRVVIPDECFVATLRSARPLRLLDLTQPPDDESQTPFDSLDIAMRYLFAAEGRAYEAARAIASQAHAEGYDGLIYPSYFSLVKEDSVPNLAVFGYPIATGDVVIKCINRGHLSSASYSLTMGPIFS